jgi:hypothetical protein
MAAWVAGRVCRFGNWVCLAAWPCVGPIRRFRGFVYPAGRRRRGVSFWELASFGSRAELRVDLVLVNWVCFPAIHCSEWGRNFRASSSMISGQSGRLRAWRIGFVRQALRALDGFEAPGMSELASFGRRGAVPADTAFSIFRVGCAISVFLFGNWVCFPAEMGVGRIRHFRHWSRVFVRRESFRDLVMAARRMGVFNLLELAANQVGRKRRGSRHWYFRFLFGNHYEWRDLRRDLRTAPQP